MYPIMKRCYWPIYVAGSTGSQWGTAKHAEDGVLVDGEIAGRHDIFCQNLGTYLEPLGGPGRMGLRARPVIQVGSRVLSRSQSDK